MNAEKAQDPPHAECALHTNGYSEYQTGNAKQNPVKWFAGIQAQETFSDASVV